MQIVTQNFGLIGGTLDASKHLGAAIPRLTSGEELRHAVQQLANAVAQPRPGSGSLN